MVGECVCVSECECEGDDSVISSFNFTRIC